MTRLDRLAQSLGHAVSAFKAGLASSVKRSRAAFIGAWAEANKWTGGAYSQRGAQRRAMINSWIYTAVELIMNEASAAKFGVVQQTDVDDEPVAIKNHPLEKLLRRPNPWIGRSFLWQYTIAWLQLDGNAYWFISTDEYGRPIELWPLPANDVEVMPGDAERFIDEYWYTANGTRFVIPTEYIVHFRLPNPFDIFRGLSPLTAAMLPADADTAMARWNGAFFGRDNVMPSAIINLSSGIPGTPIDSADADSLKDQLRTDYAATARKTAITTADSVQAVLLGWNAKDMDFYNGRQASKEEIYGIFGVPAGLLDKNATEANATIADKIFKEKKLWPLLVLIAEQLTAELVEPFYGPDLEAAFDDIRPANRALELQEDQASRETLTVDERRKRFWQLGPLPDGRGTKTVVEAQAMSAPAPFQQLDSGNPQPLLTAPEPLKALPKPRQVSAINETDWVYPWQTDLRKWRDKALKAFKAGDGATVKFESNAISPDHAAAIRAQLTTCDSLEGIKAVFASALEVADVEPFFRQGWECYG
jgi:HK97 family phage portal protein